MLRIVAVVSILASAVACGPGTPQADYVIFMGFDAMSSLGVQRAETPNFNYLIDNGAVSLHTRCVRETSSSQNWMSMVSASPIEMHTVYSNAWKRDDPHDVSPALSNNIGLYPTVFDHIRAQKPELRQYAYIEWGGEVRMYDSTAFDLMRTCGRVPELKTYRDVIEKGFEKYLEDRPEVFFLSMDVTDHIGHVYGHESQEYLDCVAEMDSLVGEFLHKVGDKGWMKNTVVIITADHGGLGYGHGGDTMAEYEVPVILYGKGVTKGKVMQHTNMIYDVGATVAGLLGVELPWECHGKFLAEAFEPADGGCYSPVPFVRPYSGRAEGEVTMSADASGSEIYYTLDGSEPDENSIHYTGPFKLDKSSQIRSVTYRNGSRSMEAVNYLNTFAGEEDYCVHYKLYKGVSVPEMPDFTKFGHPTSEGYVDRFSLDSFDFAEGNFALLLSSNFIVDEDCQYKFKFISSECGKLWIDGDLVIDNSTSHSRKPAFASKDLTAGKHRVKVEYYVLDKPRRLTLEYSKHDAPYRPFIASEFER